MEEHIQFDPGCVLESQLHALASQTILEEGYLSLASSLRIAAIVLFEEQVAWGAGQESANTHTHTGFMCNTDGTQ